MIKITKIALCFSFLILNYSFPASAQVYIFDKMMASRSLYLTANTSTVYCFPDVDFERDGPIVLEVPAGMLGGFNDAWFQYIEDIGPFGPDKGKGGKFLLLPPGHKGAVPDGYFVDRSGTYSEE